MPDAEADLVPDPYVPQGGDTNTSNSNNSVLVDKQLEYNYDLTKAPIGQKLILLTVGRIGVMGKLYGDARDNDVIGWFPLPGRNKVREEELGL